MGGEGSCRGRARPLQDMLCTRAGVFFGPFEIQGQVRGMFQVARDFALAVHGPGHPSVADTKLNTGEVYCLQGKYGRALQMYQEAQEVYVAVYCCLNSPTRL